MDTCWPTPPLPDDIPQQKRPYSPEATLLQPYVGKADAFLRGDDSPRAALERSLEAFAVHENATRAFVLHVAKDVAAAPATPPAGGLVGTPTLAALRASADAATARWRAGQPLSPIDGMPLAVKDMIETIDFPTQMNNPIFAGWHSRRDAAAVSALRQAGALILGKTVTTEFAIGNSGPTRNPYDSTRTPGGSSSGSAAAVGAGMAALALGTQTIASTIRPAGYCGAFALKPTFGALHTGGVTPLAASLDHLGLIGASLADIWASGRAIAKRVGGMPPHPGLGGPESLPEPHKPRRLIRCNMLGWAETPAPAQAAFEAWLSQLAAQGIVITGPEDDADVRRLDQALADLHEYSLDILAWESRWPFTTYLAQGAELVGERIQESLARAAAMTLDSYLHAVERREALRRTVAIAAQTCDAFVALASSGPAIQDHAFTGSRNYPGPWTLVGGPSLALPLLSVDGLPLGVQVMGAPHGDTETVAIAHWLTMQAIVR